MDQSLCKLTLVYPTSAAADLIELIMSSNPAIGGFTTFNAEGHGFDFSHASISERVRGRVERGVLVAVMPRGHASLLLETIRKALPVPHMAYWLEPVLEVGRLVESSAQQAEPAGAAT
ncbi:DUF3240 family protein [Hyphomicrobium sp. CS1GBMeth3]|uniref:DUF3240 family protein n=1 Tax=Hyphomicrobium sp. CS1GBMeth3 TaxID=1892845 RepID=UPI0009317C4E|nr:DUF3240 family protein [Hyphomicrobium sp. CS1GBMeth3]